jgi:hypothetical protein
VTPLRSKTAGDASLDDLERFLLARSVRARTGVALDSRLVATINTREDFGELEASLTPDHAGLDSEPAFTLRGLSSNDIGAVRQMVDRRRTTSWRSRVIPSAPQDFATLVWAGVLEQAVIERATDRAGVALVAVFDASFESGIAKLDVLFDSEIEWLALPTVAEFALQALRRWPLRKLYFELVSDEFGRVCSGEGVYFTTEARLVEHEYRLGEFVDLFICSANDAQISLFASRTTSGA